MKSPKPYEAKKNYFLHLRIAKETNDQLQEISENLGLKPTDLARMLLINTLKRLKADSIKYGGWKEIEFSIKHI